MVTSQCLLLVGPERTARWRARLSRKWSSCGAIETAHRALQICGQMFRYADATDRAERDASGDLSDTPPPVAPRHHALITDTKAIGHPLRDIRACESSFVTPCALLLAPLVFVRPGELLTAE